MGPYVALGQIENLTSMPPWPDELKIVRALVHLHVVRVAVIELARVLFLRW